MNETTKTVGIVLMSIALFWIGYIGGRTDERMHPTGSSSPPAQSQTIDWSKPITLRHGTNAPTQFILQPYAMTQDAQTQRFGPVPDHLDDAWILTFQDGRAQVACAHVGP